MRNLLVPLFLCLAFFLGSSPFAEGISPTRFGSQSTGSSAPLAVHQETGTKNLFPKGQGGGSEKPETHPEKGGDKKGEGQEGEGTHFKWSPPVWAVLPFLLMLLCIAILPLFAHHWWENDRNRGFISLLLGLPVLYYTYRYSGGPGSDGDLHRILHVGEEYIAFIVLLGSLFMISGGIVITGNLKGTPKINTSFLAVGGLLASFIGTTGAAMLLIRPILTTNKERKHKLHTVIFFIFIVCNTGGCLTPLGDPPLFLGFLKGVPFTWTFSLWKEWAFVVGALLVIYFFIDLVQHSRETKTDIQLDEEHDRPLIVRGAQNFLFLGGVVMAVAMPEVFEFPTREGFMILMALLAWFSTRKENRRQNAFSFGPIIEVAVVFVGIFSTMIPALALLEARGGDLGVTNGHQFFWATGGLSSFLDNAPTYVSFLALANGIHEWGAQYLDKVLIFAQGHEAHIMSFAQAKVLSTQWEAQGVQNIFIIPEKILTAISLGAVFMGAMTYIGNGPNFMVRSIANEAGIKMPSFFGYLLWSVGILVPLLFLCNWIFV